MKSVWIAGIACLLYLPHALHAQFLESNCGTGKLTSNRISNGENAEIGTTPWMAYLHQNSTLVCAGTLITHRFVLTAAHCTSTVTVRLGEYDTSTANDCTIQGCIPAYEDYEPEMAIRHILYEESQWGYPMTYDIMLIKLKKYVLFKDHIKPICLLRDPSQAAFTPRFEATGWGRTDRDEVAKVLQTVVLTKLDPSECLKSLGVTLKWGQFCAGDSRGDTCNGDSGGPLVHKMSDGRRTLSIQFGIVSYGHRSCRGVGVYTDVFSLTNWIFRVVRFYGK
ncbi:spaetzle-processing enzyme [Drosophila ficusphila]|uniref:spaetzle-processing enzyme n=1 Tax=Drosophila ficusphila TaxID=30025 RepID=UPI0007E64BB7|nr:spaetzle-processing enzyme [Drosophila ficusphila]